MAEPLFVRFWMDAQLNPLKTKDAGRNVYDTVPFCEIRVPGERDTVAGPVHRMHPDPRNRFPEAWAAFQRDNSGEGLTGTPLKMVAWIERGDLETLKYAGIKTLEQLANVTDGNLGNIPGGIALRQRARDHIKNAAAEAPMQRMSEELAKRDAEIAVLRSQLGELLEASRQQDPAAPSEVAAAPLNGTEPKRRGRPPGSKNKPKDPPTEA